MTKKIVYLMHIGWDLIKQRPQFIVEGLSKFYNVQLFCKSPIIRRSSISLKLKTSYNMDFAPALIFVYLLKPTLRVYEN